MSFASGQKPIEVIDKTSAQTMENKSFDDEITQKEIVTPTSPASGYRKTYPKSDGKFYQLDSAVEEKEMGSAAAGGADIFLSLNADIISYSDWDITNLVNASLGETTVDPLSGDKSYIMYNDSAAIVGEYVSYVKTLPLRSTTAYGVNTLKLSFKAGFVTSTSGSFSVSVIDVQNPTSVTTLEVDDDGTFTGMLGITDTTTSIEVRLSILTAGNSSIRFDDIEVSDKAYAFGSVTQVYDTETKILSVDLSSTQDAADLTFTDLVIGAEYEISGVVQFESLDTTSDFVHFRSLSGGLGDAYLGLTYDPNSSDAHASTSVAVKFVATSTTMYTRFTEGATGKLRGNGTIGETFIQLQRQPTQSDSVQFEDSYEQGHFVGKAIYNLSANYSTLSSTYIVPSDAVFGVPVVSGRLLASTNSPVITIGNAKVGTYKVTINGMIGQNELTTRAALYDGINYLETRHLTYNSSITFNYVNEQNDSLSLSLAMLTESGSASNIIDDIPLEISVSYLPPVEQASTVRMLSVNSSEDNECLLYISNSGTPVVTRSTDSGVTTANLTDDGVGMTTIDISGLNLLTVPNLTATIKTNSVTDTIFSCEVVYLSSTSITIHSEYVLDGGANIKVDLDFMLTIDYMGADRTPRNTPVVMGSQVLQEKIMILEVSTTKEYDQQAADTTYATAMNMDSLRGDIFGSIDLDVLTLPSGTYEIDVPIGSYNAGDVWFKLHNVTSGLTAYESKGLTVSTTTCWSFNTVKMVIVLDIATGFEFFAKASTSNSYMAIGSPKITKRS